MLLFAFPILESTSFLEKKRSWDVTGTENKIITWPDAGNHQSEKMISCIIKQMELEWKIKL